MAKERKNKKIRFTLVVKIAMLSVIPALVMAIVLTFAGIKAIRGGIEEEIIEKLKLTTTTIGGLCDALDEGDYYLTVDNQLFKGEYNLTENVGVLDEVVKDTGVDVTIFYEGVRRATTLVDEKTNKRMIGTSASDEVIETVLKNGGDYISKDIVINNKPYYAYYIPLKNQDGKIVGMFFAGAQVSDFQAFISKQRGILIAAAVIVGVLAIIMVAICVLSIKRGLIGISSVVTELAQGDLGAKISPSIVKRGDELGDMAREVVSLRERLTQVVQKIRESSATLLNAGQDLSQMASQTSATADEIGHAVEDISKGAVSQAEEIESASARVEEMGNMIGKIVDGVATLDNTSDEMKNAGDQSIVIIRDLSQSNDKTMDAIARIGEQVNATNESANKISEAIQLITSIAEETNLLSLNASIEAARAGEQGRGFAVVANQIQKLAEQSNESAQRIAEIIDNLVKDSENTVAVMAEVQQIVNEQQEKLSQTKSQFDNVNRGIVASRDETSGIKDQTGVCDSARTKVVDVISNLSAISQQNAASTQETTASMQELNATINLLAESAADLSSMSESLEEEIKFFRI